MRFLPQHHERLLGIAEAAGVAPAALELLERSQRFGLRVAAHAEGLDACLGIAALKDRLLLRRSFPDVGGFASVEITSAPWSGCLAGVNQEGIAVVCERDEGIGPPTARLMAQELLLRVRSLDSALDHARRRGRYVGGTWSLLVADPSGESARIECDRDTIRTSRVEVSDLASAGGVVRLEPAKRRLISSGISETEGIVEV
jgi:hypothetical protein